MPLPTNLSTNEVKNAAGTEVEFLFREEQGRSKEYAKSAETPYLPERIKVQHRDVGKTGTPALRRQSNVLMTKTVMSAVDSVTPVVIRLSISLDAPIGALANLTAVTEVVAWMNSFLSTTGAATTVLFDGTGTGAAALINGTL